MDSSATTAPMPSSESSSRRDWLVLSAASIGKLAVYFLAGFALWALAPLLFGMAVTTVASGSMEPRINTGDVVAAMPIAEDKLRPSQVILFEDPAVPDRLRLHRIVGMDDEGLRTQGDANAQADPMLVAPDAVVGVGFIRVPLIGTPINWFHQGEFLFLGIFLAALGGAALLSNLDRDLRRRDRDARRSKHRGVNSGFAARNPKMVGVVFPTAGVLLAAALVAYLVGGTAANAAFSSTTASVASFGASADFPKPWSNATFHWGYDEQSPNLLAALDDVGPSFENGVFGGGVTRATENSNPFVTFNGSSGQIYTQKFPGAAPHTFSLETWFKTTTTRGGKLIGYGNSQGASSVTYDRHLYMTDAGKLTFGILQAGEYLTVTSAKSYNDGAWHMVTVSMSEFGGGTTLYVDGVAVDSKSNMVRGQGTATDGYWRVGYDNISTSWPNRPTSLYFGGSMDNTTLYPVGLTAREVANHYAYGR